MWIDRRGLATGLCVSLAGNFVLIGFIAGYFFADRGQGLPRIGRALVPAAHIKALDPEEKLRFLQDMKRHRPDIQAARHAARIARQTAKADIAAANFDRAKVTADLAAMRQATDRLQEKIHDALVDALADLSPTSRAALIARNKPAADR